jgi:hypothetical protein
LVPAYRSEQHRVCFLGEPQRRLRQRIPRRVATCAADGRVLQLDLQAVAGQRPQNLHRLGNDFGTDAVARQHRYLHLMIKCP